MVRIIPQQFYEDPGINKILVDGLCCAVYKKFDAPIYGKEGYLSTHALTIVMQGVLRVENDEGLFDEIPAGKMVIIPKGLYTVSDIIPNGGGCFEAVMCFFEPDLIQQFLDSLEFRGTKAKSVTHAVIGMNAEIRLFVDNLLRLYGDRPRPNKPLAKTKLFELLHLLDGAVDDQHGFASMLGALNNKERKSLKEFMFANFHKPLAIEDYAYLTGRSVSTFSRDFKSKFDGIAPKQWLIERRLEKAHGLLVRNHLNTISEVALESGYSNIPHFIKEFHKRYGVTPKQFLIENRLGNVG